MSRGPPSHHICTLEYWVVWLRSGGAMKAIIDQTELAQIATLIAMVVMLGAIYFIAAG
jgi:hypothetical protein